MHTGGVEREHHRVQSVGPQADGQTSCLGAGGCQPPLLLMEGVQGCP